MRTNEGALAVALASLLLSVLALCRSRRSQALDLRADLRCEVAGLRVTMDELIARINRTLQSALERAVDGTALHALRREADVDSIQLQALRDRLNEIAVVVPLCTRGTLEGKRAVTHAIRTRVHQLLDKYRSAPYRLGERGDQPEHDLARRAASILQ